MLKRVLPNGLQKVSLSLSHRVKVAVLSSVLWPTELPFVGLEYAYKDDQALLFAAVRSKGMWLCPRITTC